MNLSKVVNRYLDHLLQMAALGLNLMFIMLAAYFHTIEDFGEFTYKYALASILAVLARFGLDSYYIYLIPRVGFSNANKKLITYSLITIPSSILLLLLYDIESVLIFIVALVAIDEIYYAVFRALNKARLFLTFRCLIYISRIAVLFLYQSSELLILVAISLSVTILISIWYFVKNYSLFDKKLSNYKNINSKSDLRFTTKTTVSNLLGVLTLKIDILMLTTMVGYAQVAVYEVASRWGFLALIPLTILSTINLKSMAKLGQRSSYKFFTIYFNDSRFKSFLITSLYFLVLLIIYSINEYYSLLPETIDLTIAVILAFGYTVNSYFGPTGTALVMMGYPGTHLFRVLLALVINFLVNLAIIPSLGALGAAISTSLVVMLSAFASYCVFKKITTKSECQN